LGRDALGAEALDGGIQRLGFSRHEQRLGPELAQRLADPQAQSP
jgi:hypothetical protein